MAPHKCPFPLRYLALNLASMSCGGLWDRVAWIMQCVVLTNFFQVPWLIALDTLLKWVWHECSIKLISNHPCLVWIMLLIVAVVYVCVRRSSLHLHCRWLQRGCGSVDHSRSAAGMVSKGAVSAGSKRWFTFSLAGNWSKASCFDLTQSVGDEGGFSACIQQFEEGTHQNCLNDTCTCTRCFNGNPTCRLCQISSLQWLFADTNAETRIVFVHCVLFLRKKKRAKELSYKMNSKTYKADATNAMAMENMQSAGMSGYPSHLLQSTSRKYGPSLIFLPSCLRNLCILHCFCFCAWLVNFLFARKEAFQ